MKRKNDIPHRRVFEKHHGRKIRSGHHIHHADGNHMNNDPSNLVEVTALEHYLIHKERGDWAACMLLARAAELSPDELATIQRMHGKKCAEEKVGIHSPDFDHSKRSKDVWEISPPGRIPVTDGTSVRKFKTEDQVHEFLHQNPNWRRGVLDNMKRGLKKSTRRLTSEEARHLATQRLLMGQHNFTTEYMCPHCSRVGKGPMMKRWHFDNCKAHVSSV